MKNKETNRRRKAAAGIYPAGWISILLILLFYPGWSFAGSDFKYMTLKHVGDITGSFNQPTEVAVGRDGSIFVLDGANNQVKVFDSRGKLLYSFGRPGCNPGEMDSPVGMDLDSQENIYLADTGNKRIEVFSKKGEYIRTIDLTAMNVRPVEVKFNPQSQLMYVSDTENHQVHCFRNDGSLAYSWGGYGKGPGEFMYPGMIDMDAAGNIEVVDILNGRLQVFDPAGKSPRQIGRFGIKPGTLFRPKGVLVDGKSRVYISDSYTGVIQVFDQSGGLVGILSEDGSSPLHLTTPLGMAMNSDGNRLYVVQAELNTVSVFAFRDGS